MISIGEHRARERALEDTLTSAFSVSIRVRLLDLDGAYKQNLTPYFLDGAVTVDADADVTRALDLTLLDPWGRIHVDPDAPGDTSVFIADVISVLYVVSSPNRDTPWEIPVFCGPISAVSRDSATVSVKALGKESLAMTNLWRGRTFHKGQEKTFVIKSILTDMVGETKMSIPNKGASLPNDQKLNSQDAPWVVAKRLAESMSMQLFYDGRGIATMRGKNTTPVVTLNGKWLLGEPTVEYDLSTVINAVRVIGGKPKKAKKNVKGKAIAQRSHRLSPWNLGRGNPKVPRYLWMEIQDDSLRTDKECNDLAQKTLKHGLLGGVTISADGIPHARLEEMDIIRVNTDNVTVTLPLRKFTIPLLVTNPASYGYHKMFQTRKPHKRHRKHHSEGIG